MRKIIAITFALMLMVGEAYAFRGFGHQTIAAIADNHLTENTKREVYSILKADNMVKHANWVTSQRSRAKRVLEWQYATLDANGKSTTTYENDGVVVIEKAAEVLRNRKNESDSLVFASLCTLIEIVGEIHCPGNIHIEGNEATKNFAFTRWNGRKVEEKNRLKSKWREMWHDYTKTHDVFTPQYYAEDLEIILLKKKAEYEKGTPRFWAENVGEDVVYCLKEIYPEAEVTNETVYRYEDINNRCMAKAGYRLAALLNDIFK